MIQLVALFEEYPPVIQLFIISIIANLVLIASWLIMGFLLMRVPEARFFLGLTFKRGGQVLEGVDPAGGVKFYHVKADAGQGVLRGKKKLYIFIHRLLKLDPKTENGTAVSETEKTERELARGKKTYNELLQKRNILDGCGRVIYHALIGSSIGGTAKLIAETEKVRIKAIQGGKPDPGLDWEALARLIRKNSPEESVLITPFSVESLAEYVKVSYSPSDIQMAWDEGYLAGLGVKVKGGFNIWWLVLIVGILLLLVAGAMLIGGGGGTAQSIIPNLPGGK